MNKGDTVVIYNLYSQFEEIAMILTDTLNRIGLKILRANSVSWNNNYVYILFGVNIWEDDIPFPERFIVMQLEQNTIRKWFNSKYLARLACADQVWDYNLENVEYLQDRGIDAVHVPIGYIPLFDPLIPLQDEEPIDIVFLGLLNNAYRKKVLERLSNEGFKLVARDNVYGEEKKKLIMSSKVVINIHYGGDALLEEARLIPFLSCSRIVVSETVSDSRYVELYKDVVDFVNNVEEMVTICRKWINTDRETRRRRQNEARKWVISRSAISLFPKDKIIKF